MNYLVALSSYLENVSEIKHQLLFYPNSSLYKIGNQYKYIEYQSANLKRSYSIEGVDYSVYIQHILNGASKGKTIDALTDIIIDGDITKKEATNFINELIDNQILISELEPSVIGNDMFSQIISILNRLKGCSYYLKSLTYLQQVISKIDDDEIYPNHPSLSKLLY